MQCTHVLWKSLPGSSNYRTYHHRFPDYTTIGYLWNSARSERLVVSSDRNYLVRIMAH